MDKDIEWKIKKSNFYLYVILLVFITGLGAIYYYGMHKMITPDGETLSSMMQVKLAKDYGYEWPKDRIFVRTFSIFYKYYGFSYKTVRLTVTTLYSVINLFAFDVAVRRKNGYIRIYAIPIYVLFMIVVNTAGDYTGKFTEMVSQYFFDTHMEATLFSVIGIWLVYYLSDKTILLCIVSILYGLIGYKFSDMLFVICFVFPVVCAGAICAKEKRKKIYMYCGISAIAILKVLSFFISGFQNLFITSSTPNYSTGYFYGIANFTTVQEIPNHFYNYVSGIMGIFNVDFWGGSVQNIGFVASLVKIMLVINLFILMVKSFIRKEDNQDQSDRLPEYTVLLGIVFLSFFYMLTSNSNYVNARYLSILLPYGTIFLCWNYEKLSGKMLIWKNAHPRELSIIIILCIVISWNPGWNKEKEPDSWDITYQNIVNTVEQEGLHCGLGNIWFMYNVMALSDGNCLMASCERRDEPYGLRISTPYPQEDSVGGIIDYIVIADHDWGQIQFSVDEIKELYGEPTKVVDVGEMVMLIYKDGRLATGVYQ